MQAQTTPRDAVTRRHRPKTLTVFAAAFAAGAVLAYGVDRVVDVHVVQVEPQVESEPIFVALRTLPQGSPITVWDVALKDWPKAMLPTTALKADASFEGMVLRHPVREGQPLLSVQLVRDGAALPSAGLAMLPPAVGPAGGAAAAMSSPAAGQPGPPVAEQFVPATPAEAPVAATETAALGAVAAAPEIPPEAARVADAPAAATTDPDIDPAVAAATVPSDAASGARTVSPEVPAVDRVATDEVEQPALVSSVAPQPAEPTVAPPLAAPLPALPTTDIAPSLVTVGRTNQAPAGAAASVLDRTNRAPAPQTPAASPRHHLVVPERVALAADASFTQRPVSTVQPPVAPVQGMPAAAQTGSRRPNPPAPATARQPRTNPTPRPIASRANQPAATAQTRSNQSATNQSATKQPTTKNPVTKAPSTRPLAPRRGATRVSEPGAAVAKPAAAQAEAQPQSSRPLGLGAWFPQLSAGNRQR